MTRSPFTRVNADTFRAERMGRLQIAGSVCLVAIISAGLFAIGALALEASLAIPDITARAAAQARW
jgi:hypothetical protein